jgi:hypothetical protein
MRRLRAWAGRAAASLALVALCSAASGVRATAGRREASLPRFGRVVLIVFENKHSSEVLGTGQAPTFDLLARRFAVLTDYYGVAHPSLPNYLALVSGSTQGIDSDCTDCVVDAPNLADTLQAADRTWKTYAEGLPAVGFTRESSTGRYAKRHNPFVYFSDVLARRDRLQRIVPLTRLRADVAARRLPDFALVVPDTCHDMHDCPVASGDAWLASFLPPCSPARRCGVALSSSSSTRRRTRPRASGCPRSCSDRWFGRARVRGRGSITTACCGRSSRRGACPSWARARRLPRSRASGAPSRLERITEPAGSRQRRQSQALRLPVHRLNLRGSGLRREDEMGRGRRCLGRQDHRQPSALLRHRRDEEVPAGSDRRRSSFVNCP